MSECSYLHIVTSEQPNGGECSWHTDSEDADTVMAAAITTAEDTEALSY